MQNNTSIKNLNLNRWKKITYSNWYRLTKRIISFPFVLGLLIMAHGLFVIVRTFSFLIRGGEFINYDNKNDPKSIQNIYELLKEQNGIKN